MEIYTLESLPSCFKSGFPFYPNLKKRGLSTVKEDNC